MRMTEHQRVERGRLERKRIRVAGFGFGTALDHAAVEQQAMPGGLDFMQGTGHLTGGTVEFHAHAACPRLSIT